MLPTTTTIQNHTKILQVKSQKKRRDKKKELLIDAPNIFFYLLIHNH